MKAVRSIICFIVTLHSALAVPLVCCQLDGVQVLHRHRTMATPLNGQRSHNTRLLRSRNVPSLASLSVSHSSPFHSYRSNTYRYVTFPSSQSEKDTLSVEIFNDTFPINSSSNLETNVSFPSLPLSRIKRDDDVDTFPTRHAKHRRKRRCKNRPTCSRLTTSQQKFSETQQSNDYDIDTYNEKFIDGYTEAKENVTIDDYVDGTDLSLISIPTGDLSTLLTRLFQTLRNTSIEDSQEILKGLNFVGETVDEDPCQKWLNSKDKLEQAFLGPFVALPACPCQYPSNIFYDDKLWDEKQQKHFRWRDVSGESHRLDVYKPGAAYCVRSLLAQGSGSAATQHCCYDRQRRLLTRGSGAGTPNFVSPEISIALHEKIDILPWRLCKGDFSRFNKVRPPNNDNGCADNPDNEEYQRQINNTKYY